MTMKRILMVAILLALPLAAQEKKPEEPHPAMVQKLFILKYADPRAVEPLLRVFGQAVPNAEMHAIAVTASSQNMPAIEEAIARLDTPPAAPKNIDLTCYLLVGSDSDGAAGALPKDVETVVTQLKNTFPFKNYRLMDVLASRTRTGRNVDVASVGGSMTGASSEPVTTKLHINSVSTGGDNSTIRIDGLRANSRVPIPVGNGLTNFNYQDLGISTDVDMKEGQKIVVGRIGISKDQAMFLVLTAKIVN
jgi:hypothetical protein